ncbi:MAG TPA: acyl-CoA thioesterase II [Ginsengibacter sp.]|nr:acyl-CoA thioesterase II [Chitinophagaceae bacterium]HRN72995.1 acyl-CoA thioesterase II [Ginsengibacter sp.]HRP16515.1 acyl-CoA thioesterase II [Ginsengibacter sp.]HRP43605.1 acyl-CoA thioesterase II [Ginsengibacter sp.]
MKTIRELLELIELEQKDEVVFEGRSETVGSPNVFGGQVLAQALNAAYRTVSAERLCHSLHSYFILPGDLNKPIRYKVQLVRDGGSFTTRYVTAEQNDKSIFVLAASFQVDEEGYTFQEKMPEVGAPETFLSLAEIYEQMKAFLPEKLSRYLNRERPVTYKPVILPNPFEKKDLPPYQNLWFQFNETPGGLSVRHFHEILAYTSDYNLLPTALQPHASHAHPGNTMMATLDHAMWFHRVPKDFAGWFLYHIDVLNTSNARAMLTGKIFTQSGDMIATVAQEGLLRKIEKR